MNKLNKIYIKIGVIILVIVICSILIYINVFKPKLEKEYISLGNKYLQEENYDESIISFNKLIKINKKNTDAMLGLSKAYIGKGSYDKAIEMLKKAQSIDIENFQLLLDILDIMMNINADISYEILQNYINQVGERNIDNEVKEIVELSKENPVNPIVNPISGKYVKPVEVKLEFDKLRVGHSYYYTIDGSEPSKKSNKYNTSIKVDRDTKIKLIGYNKYNASTEIVILDYIIDLDRKLDLEKLIKEVQEIVNKTDVGTEIGNVDSLSKEKVSNSIDKASSLLEKKVLSYEEVNDAYNELERVFNDFKNSIIQSTDKSELSKNIDKAQKLYENSTEGSRDGQYKVGSKKSLLEAINNARETYANCKNQEIVDRETNILKKAISNFESKKIESFSKQDAINQAIGRFGAVGYGENEAGHELKTTGYKVVGDLKVESGVKYYSIEVSQVVKTHPPYEENGEWECDFPTNRKFIINSYEDGRCY